MIITVLGTSLLAYKVWLLISKTDVWSNQTSTFFGWMAQSPTSTPWVSHGWLDRAPLEQMLFLHFPNGGYLDIYQEKYGDPKWSKAERIVGWCNWYQLIYSDLVWKRIVNGSRIPIWNRNHAWKIKVPLETIFDAMPGDIFALRNAGNTCTHATWTRSDDVLEMDSEGLATGFWDTVRFLWLEGAA